MRSPHFLFFCVLLRRPTVESFKVFFDGKNNTKITFWHDFVSNSKLCDLVDIGWLDSANAYTVVNFSQYFSRGYHMVVVKPFECLGARKSVLQNVLLLANSEEEIYILRDFCNDCDVLFFPNNAFLDHNLFSLRNSTVPNVVNQSDPLCILNAKGHKWKRHDLSVPIPNRIFVTYDRKPNTHLEIYNPRKIYQGISPSELIDILHQSDFGGAFTPSEGNCYASNEYLLTGLPVLSVKSIGGRDTFYKDGVNAIICNASLEGVTEGYQRMKSLILNNLDRVRIRRETVEMVESFRDNLTEKVLGWLVKSGNTVDDISQRELVKQALFKVHKAANYINFYKAAVGKHPGPATFSLI
eukprot:gene5840-11791_t